MAEDKPFWETKNTAFATATAADDFLHPEFRQQITDPSLTETQYFGFNIPEENIHGLCYMWHHPNLGVVTGGAWAWQGTKRYNLQCELYDFVTFMSDECLSNDLHDYTLDNSYRAQVLEPLKRYRIRYSDPKQNNSFDIHYQAVTAPMLLSSGLHLEQPLRAKGQLRLLGNDYEVDCYTVRDRSWGAPRPEVHQDFPAMAWMTGVFNDDFAFGCTAFDSPDSDPEWAGILEIPGGETVKGGWVYTEGEMVPIVNALKKTVRDPNSLYVQTLEMELVDAMDRSFLIRGEARASAEWHTWHNFSSVISLTRWEYDGLVTHGDHQECFWQHYVRAMNPRR
ncbi:hypothetical protein HBA55_04585 [Pseudomaricurvus alkylphenolicus]|uniref:DUF7064 domain-containing protein n=1 Tax=Pseudomaricurvus alkylphenolicus TaxID=1306991 RepID=UPI0014207A39|nr:hypothetical protein [Pseudomaricurvus alkylphenolicus]NIB38849.1 hypothetical protein [Pseudomaricurvus alkylphenolicus]